MKNICLKSLKILGISIASIFALALIIAIGATIWLTPTRLTALINQNAGKYLNAKVSVSDADYTFWSSFPNISISGESLSIVSNALLNLPDSLTAKLPAGADSLFSCGPFEASINIRKAISGDIDLSGIVISRPVVNIVVANDTVGNFSILPKSETSKKSRRILIAPVRINGGLLVSFHSLPILSSAKLNVGKALIKPPVNMSGIFGIQLEGTLLEAGHAGISLPKPMPLSIDGEISALTNPSKISANDFYANIGGLNTSTSFFISGKKGNTIIDSLSIDIVSSDIIKLLQYVPKEIAAYIPAPVAGIIAAGALLPVDLTIALESPYPLKTTSLPDLSVRLKVAGASFNIPLDKKRQISVDSLRADLSLRLTPDNPEASSLKISELQFSTAEKSSLLLNADIGDLLSGEPEVSALADFSINLPAIAGLLPATKSIPRIDGEMTGKTDLKCRLSTDGGFSILSLTAKGNLASSKIKTSAKDSSRLYAKGLRIGYALAGNPSGGGKASARVRLQADRIESANRSQSFSVNNLVSKLSASQRTQPFTASQASMTYSSSDDSIICNEADHSPLYLAPSLPNALADFLTFADFSADISADSGKFRAKGYPTDNRFSRIHLSATPDYIDISNIDFSIDGMKGRLKGAISELRSFAIAPKSSELKAEVTAVFDNIDINRLCGAYYDGQYALTDIAPDFKVESLEKTAKADSLCIAIPRNISARMNLSSNRAEYMQYSFSKLSTTLSMHDGKARIGDLSISAPYADSKLDWTYSTTDLSDFSMILDLDVGRFDFSGFLHAFPSLTKDAPQLQSLHGTLSANAKGSFKMFPDMFVNAPSMQARADVKGTGLEFDRTDDQIRHISHLMLIRGDSPLKIDGLDIHAQFLDNMLRVMPFTLSAGPYRVMLAGVNNLQGEIYYHAGLMHSPFHLPFGINLVGDWRHPFLRFGGKELKDGREREIASNLKDDVEVNIMQRLKHGWLEFVALAAKYDAKTRVE